MVVGIKQLITGGTETWRGAEKGRECWASYRTCQSGGQLQQAEEEADYWKQELETLPI